MFNGEKNTLMDITLFKGLVKNKEDNKYGIWKANQTAKMLTFGCGERTIIFKSSKLRSRFIPGFFKYYSNS
jgi:hypothetical protein